MACSKADHGLEAKSTESLESLAQLLYDVEIKKLHDHTNKFFQQVTADVCLLSDSTMPSTSDCTMGDIVIEQTTVEKNEPDKHL